MSAVCTSCANVYEGGASCPRCGATPSSGPTPGTVPGWQQTIWGRGLIGLVVGQGLFYGLKQLLTGAMLAIQGGSAEELWADPSNVLVLLGIQLFAMLCGGVMAGGGQQGGLSIGAIVGAWNGVLAVVLQQVPPGALGPMGLYVLPVAHGVVGGLGGLIGAWIWAPLPVAVGPDLAGPRKAAPRREKPWLAGPVAWLRVVIGSALAVAGALYAGKLLDLIADLSNGRYGTVTDLQDSIITWQARALSLLLGGAFAGAFTSNGLKQGLVVGILSSLVLVGIQPAPKEHWLELTALTAVGSLSLAAVGGWFGGQFLPPVVDVGRRVSAEI